METNSESNAFLEEVPSKPVSSEEEEEEDNRHPLLKFHIKNRGIDYDLIIFRCLSLLLWTLAAVIDSLKYSTLVDLGILFVMHSIMFDIAIVIYASGAAAFGMSFEVYIFVPWAFVNLILVTSVCGNHQDIQLNVLYVVRTIYFLLAAELTHRNFARLKDYKKYFNSSSSSMLRQSLFFTVTMLSVIAPGLRTMYESAGEGQEKGHRCLYKNITQCHILDMYQPLFNDNDHHCKKEYIQFLAGAEQLRIFRNFVLTHIAFYSMFNKPFLDISKGHRFYVMRSLILFLFLFMTTSVLLANILPFKFIKVKFYYEIAECCIFAITAGLLAYTLRYPNKPTDFSQTSIIMDKRPKILP